MINPMSALRATPLELRDDEKFSWHASPCRAPACSEIGMRPIADNQIRFWTGRSSLSLDKFPKPWNLAACSFGLENALTDLAL